MIGVESCYGNRSKAFDVVHEFLFYTSSYLTAFLAGLCCNPIARYLRTKVEIGANEVIIGVECKNFKYHKSLDTNFSFQIT